MSIETLRRMQQSYRSEEDAMDAAAAADQKQRETPTPAKKLPGEIEEMYTQIVGALGPFQAYRPHDAKSAGLAFRVDMAKLDAFGTANDVMAGVIAKFEARGFECRHTYNVGVNTLDWLEIKAPSDWVQRVLTPIATTKKSASKKTPAKRSRK